MPTWISCLTATFSQSKLLVLLLYLTYITIPYRFRLRHVGDDPVSYDEQDKVLGAIGEVPCDVCHVVDRRREVGRAIKLDSAEAAFVSGKNSCNAG